MSYPDTHAYSTDERSFFEIENRDLRYTHFDLARPRPVERPLLTIMGLSTRLSISLSWINDDDRFCPGRENLQDEEDVILTAPVLLASSERY